MLIPAIFLAVVTGVYFVHRGLLRRSFKRKRGITQAQKQSDQKVDEQALEEAAKNDEESLFFKYTKGTRARFCLA